MTEAKRCSMIRRDLEDALETLPLPQRFESTNPGHLDAIIFAKGFEERSVAVPLQLVQAKSIGVGTMVLVGEYKTNTYENGQRFEHLSPALTSSGATVVMFDADEPSATYSSIASMLRKLAAVESPKILFDTSGASCTLIFSVIGSLFRDMPGIELWIIYAEASKYYPDAAAHGTLDLKQRRSVDWAEKTPREEGSEPMVYHALYDGCEHDSRPHYIIGVPGFATARFAHCVKQIGDEDSAPPAEVMTLVLPYSAGDEHQWRGPTVQELTERVFAGAADQQRLPAIVKCGATEYLQMIKIILESSESHLGENVYLVHFGTKLQTLGAAIALLARSEIALVTARPRTFNADQYSEGIGPRWSIHFDDLGKVVKRLSDVGCISVNWDEAGPNVNKSGSS